MATYVQQDTRGPKHGADGRGNKPRHQTLEDVAEEMLNGMFCHYEPPDPHRAKSKRRGILRTSSRDSRHRKTEAKSVRWVDKPEERKPPLEIRCNVASNCVDAGIEAGCISPKRKEKATEILSKYDYDLQPTDSMDSRVPYRHSHIQAGLSFDDDGYPISEDGASAPPPPPPPPPSRSERFIPELCGVSINCVDDDAQMEKLARSSAEGPARRPRQPFDYDDEENSLMKEDDDDDDEEEDIKILEDGSEGSEDKEMSVETFRQSLKDQGKDSTGKSALFRRMVPFRRSSSKENATPMLDRSDADEKPSHFSPESPGRRQKPAELDPIELERADDVQPRRSPMAFLKRMSPRNKKSEEQKDKDWDNAKEEKSDDWDDSVPIVPNQSDISAVSQSSSRRWSLRGKKQDSRDPSPGSIRRTRSRSTDAKEDRGRPSEAKEDRGRPSEAKEDRGRPSEAKEDRRRSFDPKSLLKRRNRSKSPGRGMHSRSHSIGQSDHRVSEERRSQKAASRRASDEGHAPQKSPSRPQLHPGEFMSPAAQAHLPHPHLHPAHPLNQRGKNKPRQRDDMTERQSFITAHRRNFGDVDTSTRKSKPAERSYDDDRMERQSFITAHRLGHSDGPVTKSKQKQTSSQEDDRMERQSMITAHRQAFGDVPAQQPSSRGSQSRSRTAPAQKQMMSALQEDDRLERQSMITAHRQAFGDIPPQQPSSRRSRSRSPGRSKSPQRSRSPARSPTKPSKSNSFGQELQQKAPQGIKQGFEKSPKKGRSALPTRDPRRRVSDPVAHHVSREDAQSMIMTTSSFDTRAKRAPTASPHQQRQADPPLPRQPTQLPIQAPMQQQQHPRLEPQPSSERQANVEAAASEENELSWEESTRQAWERLRSGLSASFSMEAPSDEKEENETAQAEKESIMGVKAQTQMSTERSVQSPSLPREQAMQTQPYGILKTSSYDKHVRFGQNQERVFHDDQDENDPTGSPHEPHSSPIMAHSYHHLGSQANPNAGTKKTKKVLRGTKLVNGVLGKAKNTLGKISLSRSRSMDSIGSTRSMSQEWVNGYMYAQQTNANYLYPQQPMQLANYPNQQQSPMHPAQPGYYYPYQQPMQPATYSPQQVAQKSDPAGKAMQPMQPVNAPKTTQQPLQPMNVGMQPVQPVNLPPPPPPPPPLQPVNVYQRQETYKDPNRPCDV